MQKVYIRGVQGRGKDVIAKLVELGAKNTFKLIGDDPNKIYYINDSGDLDCVDEVPLSKYVKIGRIEIFLDQSTHNATIKEYDPVMVSDDGEGWRIKQFYRGRLCYSELTKQTRPTFEWKYIVPFADFDFNDLESNVKRSII